jgi:hypothetical protein
MSLKKQLIDLGFQQIPSLDPAHFLHRSRVGYLLLVQTRNRLSYQLHTVNAHRCLETARKAVLGYYVDRAMDLKAALEASQIDDWTVYFRPDGLYPGLAEKLESLLRRYKSLNTRRSRLDPEADTWGYQVTYPKYARGFTITSARPQSPENLIADFLHKWRNALDAALNRHSIDLTTYYVGCNQIAEASRQWMDNRLTEFCILSTTAGEAGKRKIVVAAAGLDNHRFSMEYRENLLARA